ncbi:hypothetical protein [Runella zeae]|uniref:hypothetical protein n=1 Tax=Runella zeae TaxID=94255 RepID=UPI000428DA87|nr:hypothetical protein [Runella zeae]
MVAAQISPPENGFSKDRLVYRFQADDYIQSPGSYAVNRLYFTAAVPSNITIQIRFNGQTQTFTVVSAGNPSNGTNLIAGNGSLTYAQSLLPYFNANTFLSKYFTMSAPNNLDFPSVVFTAKQKGKAYEFVEVTFAWGKLQVQTAATDFALRSNHCILFQLKLEQEDGSTFDKIYETYLPTTVSGKAEIDVADILNSHLQLSVERPIWGERDPVVSRKSTRRYQVEVAEAYGTPLQLQTSNTLPTKRVFWGGSGYSKPHEMSYLIYGNSKMIALKNGPDIRFVMTDEPQWLTFYGALGASNALYRIEITWHDNSVTTHTLQTVAVWQYGQKVIFTAGHNQLNLPSYTSTQKRVKEYTLYIVEGATEISRRYRYIVDANLRDRRKYFVYLNSLGAWEVLVAKGIEERRVEYNLLKATKRLSYPNVTGDAEEFQYHGDYTQSFTCNTGYQSRDEQKRFRDFVLSPYKYRFFNGTVAPVIVTDERHSENADEDNRLFVSFNYRYAFKSNALLQ